MWYKLWPSKQSYLAAMFFKLMQYGYETFQNVASILHSECCFNSALQRWILLQLQTQGYCKRKGVVISFCFLWKLLLFIVKRFYNLLYNPICGLLCLLSYWGNIVTHKLIMVKLKKIINSSHFHAQTTLHVNDCKFHKPGKWRKNKNWWWNWFL